LFRILLQILNRPVGLFFTNRKTDRPFNRLGLQAYRLIRRLICVYLLQLTIDFILHRTIGKRIRQKGIIAPLKAWIIKYGSILRRCRNASVIGCNNAHFNTNLNSSDSAWLHHTISLMYVGARHLEFGITSHIVT